MSIPFERRGYPTDGLQCEHRGCKNTETVVEPRFGYVFCEEHMDVPPAYFEREALTVKKNLRHRANRV